MHPSHIAANGVEQQSVIPPPAPPHRPPQPQQQQLYRPHALGFCLACCLGYSCHLLPTFTPRSSPPLWSFTVKEGAAVRGGVIYSTCWCVHSSMKMQHLDAFINWLYYLRCLSSIRTCFFLFSAPVFPSACYVLLIFPSINPSALVHN